MNPDDPPILPPHGRRDRDRSREHRRLRRRRHRRRAYIRSVYFLPSMATLGNAICGFAAMYVTTLQNDTPLAAGPDPIAQAFSHHRFLVAAYLIFAAMIFDALDGRLARFTRHTTDFGGQLDSLADVVSFGCAPAFLALQLFKTETAFADYDYPVSLTRLVWAVGALYMSCAAIRLARFNVSNEHGEQHHFSFLGLPSPGAGAVVASFILMQQDLALHNLPRLAHACTLVLPLIVCAAGLLMVSAIRYPHFVNQYLRGKRSIGRLIFATIIALLFLVAHRYVLALGTLTYVLLGPLTHSLSRLRRKPAIAPAPTPPPPPPTPPSSSL
jgi:CDP-diacylglycerol--serine O-phosphatidyltransferase